MPLAQNVGGQPEHPLVKRQLLGVTAQRAIGLGQVVHRLQRFRVPLAQDFDPCTEDLLVERKLFRVAPQCAEGLREVVHRLQRACVPLAQDFCAQTQHLLVERQGLCMPSQAPIGGGQAAHGGKGVRVSFAMGAPQGLDRLFEQPFGLAHVTTPEGLGPLLQQGVGGQARAHRHDHQPGQERKGAPAQNQLPCSLHAPPLHAARPNRALCLARHGQR